MRILFLGTPDFSVPALDALHEAGHSVVLVVTRRDSRRGRGRRLAAPPVKEAALRAGLEVFQPRSVNEPEAVDRLRRAAPELGVVVAYGEILRQAALSVAPRGFLNVHASLLPKYRGAAPINWAVIRGEKQTGVTVQRMVPQLDAGPILAQRPIPIAEHDTAGDVHDRLCGLGADLLLEVVNRLERGDEPPERRQDPACASYAPKLTRQDARVDWSRPAEQIRDLVRGLTPWPGASTRFVGADRAEDVVLLRVESVPNDPSSAPPGTVLRADDREGIAVQAGRGAVMIRALRPASGRAMTGADFIHGRRVKGGDRFA